MRTYKLEYGRNTGYWSILMWNKHSQWWEVTSFHAMCKYEALSMLSAANEVRHIEWPTTKDSTIGKFLGPCPRRYSGECNKGMFSRHGRLVCRT